MAGILQTAGDIASFLLPAAPPCSHTTPCSLQTALGQQLSKQVQLTLHLPLPFCNMEDPEVFLGIPGPEEQAGSNNSSLSTAFPGEWQIIMVVLCQMSQVA